MFRSLYGCSAQGFGWDLRTSLSSTVLVVSFGSLFCWKVSTGHSQTLCALWSMFSSSTSPHLAAIILPCILTSLPIPTYNNIMLPPPCFSTEMVLSSWWAVPGFLPDVLWGGSAQKTYQTRKFFLILFKSFKWLPYSFHSGMILSSYSTIKAWMECFWDDCISIYSGLKLIYNGNSLIDVSPLSFWGHLKL